jgi:glyoxylase-like metal-dependent hydrolase (beta-lactamase superfamily II)/ferredoxin
MDATRRSLLAPPRWWGSVADRARSHPRNAPGPWFVDTTCIDCDVVRHLAPDLFGEAADGKSFVRRQPRTPEEELAMVRGMLACPTGSVGGPLRKELVAQAYPWPVEGPVSMLGYTSEDSFGAMAYLVERPHGNVMVDGPRWSGQLEQALEARGGLAHVLLTHRDDVADAGRYAERFGAKVWIHEDDADAAPDGVELRTFRGEVEVQPGVVAFPTPGHTRGHAIFLVDDRFLFSGDSLAGSRGTGDLTAWEGVAWYDWPTQLASLERLAEERTFAWVLPGHGARFHAPPEEMRARLVALVARLRVGEEPGGW